MAFLPQNEQNQYAPQGQTSNNPAGQPPPQSSGSTGAGASGPKAGTSQGTPTQFGSSASKLSDYLTANAPQIGQQANSIAGNLNTQYQQTGQGIQNAANQFGQQVQQGYTAPNQQLVNQAAANPTQFVADPNNVQAFKAQYNNQYNGPQNFEGSDYYTNVQSDVNKAVNNAGLLNTEAGLTNYFAGQGKNPTKAASTLNSLLLQGNPEAKQTIKTAADQFKGLNDQLNAAKTASNEKVNAAKAAADQSRQYAQQTFNPVVDQFTKNINEAAQNAEAQRQAFNTSQQQAYNQLTPLQQYVQAYKGNAGVQIDNPLEALLSQQPIISPITAQNSATPEQYAQAAAIQQLLGGTAQLPIDASTASQAGTAPTVGTPNTFNMSDLAKQLALNATKAQLTKNVPDSSINPTTPFEQSQFLSGQLNPDSPYETLLGQLQKYNPDFIKTTHLGGYLNRDIPGEYWLGQ